MRNDQVFFFFFFFPPTSCQLNVEEKKCKRFPTLYSYPLQV